MVMMMICIVILCIFPELVTMATRQVDGQRLDFKKLFTSVADASLRLIGKRFVKKRFNNST